MKILSVVIDLDKGGTQRAAQNFAEAYHALGHDSQMLAIHEGGPRKAELEQAGVQVWLGLSEDILTAIGHWKPDVVHLHSNALPTETVYQLKQLCQTAKFVETNVFSKPSEYAHIIDYSYQLSAWCKYLYLARGGDLKKCFILANPIKVDNFQKAKALDCLAFRKQYNIPEHAFLFGRVGQSWPGKWSEHLIDVFERFLNKVHEPAFLLLVNPPEEIITYAKRKKLSDKLIHIEKIIGDAELSICYSAIDIFLHIAYQGESFGLALAESLLCETPVITLNTPWADNSQAEVIGNRVGGLCANTVDEFFQLTIDLYSDELMRYHFGRQGRNRIINKYDHLLLAQQSIDIIVNGTENQEMPLPATLAGIKNNDFRRSYLTTFLVGLKQRNLSSHRLVNYLLKHLASYKAASHLVH